MKTLSASLKAVVIASLACAAGLAAAGDSQVLTVNATVDGTCKFSSATNTLAFGAIDPSLAADKTVTLGVLYKCTKGTAAPTVVTSDASYTRTMTGAVSTNKLDYTLSIGATSAGLGFAATASTVAVSGKITPAQYQAAAADSYSETVTLNITP